MESAHSNMLRAQYSDAWNKMGYKMFGAAQVSHLSVFCLLGSKPTLIQSKKMALVYSFPTMGASLAGAMISGLQSSGILQQPMIFCNDLFTKNTSDSKVAGPECVIYSEEGIHLH